MTGFMGSGTSVIFVLKATDHRYVVPLDPAFQSDLKADRFGGLGVGLIFQGPRDDLVQNRDGGSGQPPVD